jgi:adenylate cyclase
MQHLFRSIYLYFSRVPAEFEVQSWRFYLVSNFANTMGLLVHIFWVALFSIMNVPVLAWINVASSFILAFNIFLIRRKHLVPAAVIAVLVLLLEYSISTRYLGLELEFQYFILLISLFPLMIPDGHFHLKHLLFFLCLAAFVGIDFWVSGKEPMVAFGDQLAFRLRVFNLATSFVVLGMYAMFYNYAMGRTEDKFQEMYDEAQSLLHNILPESIARELKENPHAIADKYPAVSVVFADLVGFTQLSTRVEPIDLVNLLNDIFSGFDDLVEKHGMEKIKTIGDAYMAVAGLPEAVPDHAERTAEMALDMLESVKLFNFTEDTHLSIRIGIASGSVVAGVIGKKKFSYDLWGDTVNTASRMESHGVPDRIQVCQATYDLLSEHFAFEERGRLEVKGKGTMETYFLLGKKPNGDHFP